MKRLTKRTVLSSIRGESVITGACLVKKLLGMVLMAVMVSGPLAQAHGGGGGGYSHGGWSGRGGWGWGLGLGLGLGWCAGCYSYPSYCGYPYYYGTPVVYAAPVGPTLTAIPAGYQSVVMDGVTYYTINGVTYYQTTAGLCPVAQPPQVVVNYSAASARPTPAAYVSGPATSSPAPATVAPAPQPVASSSAVSAPVTAEVAAPKINETYTINIPNARGSYSAVTLTRSGSGFTGPQGEYYPDFPKVALLQVMYGK